MDAAGGVTGSASRLGVARDLSPYVPALALRWQAETPRTRHRAAEGSLVFADVSGFTALSERLALTEGKAGAELTAALISELFDGLLRIAAMHGGELLKCGGDALLLFFAGDGHPVRACASAAEMQRHARSYARGVEDRRTRVRMSVGVHTGTFDLFKVGSSHQELVVCGPEASTCVAMEALARAGQIVMSAATTALIPRGHVGARHQDGFRLRGLPDAGVAPPLDPRPDDTGAFLAARVRSYLASGPVVAEHRAATIAFLHITGVDGMLRDRDVGAAGRALHETLSAVQDSFDAFGVSFLGTDIARDGVLVMAATGVPAAGESDDEAMVRALHRAVSARTPLALRAGAQRGHVFVGDIGSDRRRTFTCLGDIVNTAARVTDHAAVGEVLILEPLRARVASRIESTELAPFAAKGKRTMLVPHRVDRVVGRADGTESRTHAFLPYIGREGELAAARDAARGLAAGKGGVLDVVGPAGIGKTRLVEELLQGTSSPHVMVRCDPYERTTPFFVARRLLAAHCGSTHRSLQSTVERVAPGLLPLLPLLAAVLDMDGKDNESTASLDGQTRRRRTVTAITELLRALVPEPTLFVIEDVHWIDDASADVLAELGRHTNSRPWLLLVTRRPGPTAYRPPPRVIAIQLDPLGPTAVKRLVAAAPGRPLPPHARERLAARADGNPLFLAELLGSDARTEEVPDSLEAVLAAQVDALPASDRRLLRSAAVIGVSFSIPVLAQVTDAPWLLAHGADVARRLHELVRPESDGYLRFRHHLLRDVAYEGLLYRQRRDLHSRAFDAIEQANAGEPERVASALALHALHAHRYHECWRWALVAAKRASEFHAPVEELALLEQAVSVARFVSPPADELSAAWDALGRSALAVGAHGRAREAFGRARAHVVDPRARARLCAREANVFSYEGRLVGASRRLHEALRLLDAQTDQESERVRGPVLVQLGWLRNQQGRHAEAASVAQAALASAVSVDDQLTRAKALNVIDTAAVFLARGEVQLHTEELLAIFDGIESVDEGSVLQNAGANAYVVGQWQQALTLFQRSRAAFVRDGSDFYAAWAGLGEVEILLKQGRGDEADELLRELEQVFESVDRNPAVGWCLRYRADVLRTRGDLEAELVFRQRAHRFFGDTGSANHARGAAIELADTLLRLGRVEEAEELATGDFESASISAWVKVARGNLDLAWEELEARLSDERAKRNKYGVLVVLEELAVLASLTGTERQDEAELRASLKSELGIVEMPPPPFPAGTSGPGKASR